MLYDVKRISFCPSRYWPTVAVASSRGGALEYRASLVRTEYEAAASALDARTVPGQRPGTDGRVPPPQSEHRRQSISSPRSLRFAAWSSAALLPGGPGRSATRRPPCSGCVVVSPASVALAWRPLYARRAVLHDLDAALSGRLRRGRCACPPPPLASRAHRGLWPLRRPLRICRARLLFADRLRAGAGRRSGSGWMQGRVRWGRPLLSRPRGAGSAPGPCGC